MRCSVLHYYYYMDCKWNSLPFSMSRWLSFARSFCHARIQFGGWVECHSTKIEALATRPTCWLLSLSLPSHWDWWAAGVHSIHWLEDIASTTHDVSICGYNECETKWKGPITLSCRILISEIVWRTLASNQRQRFVLFSRQSVCDVRMPVQRQKRTVCRLLNRRFDQNKNHGEICMNSSLLRAEKVNELGRMQKRGWILACARIKIAGRTLNAVGVWSELFSPGRRLVFRTEVKR